MEIIFLEVKEFVFKIDFCSQKTFDYNLQYLKSLRNANMVLATIPTIGKNNILYRS